MTPRQLRALAEEHRYHTDPKAQRPIEGTTEDERGTAGFALALAAMAARRR